MVDIQDNLEAKDRKSKNKLMLVFAGVFYVAVGGARFYFGADKFTNLAFYGLSAGFTVLIAILLMFNKNEVTKIERMYDKPVEIEEKIAKEVIDMSDIPNVMNEILTNRGLRLYDKGSEILGTYGDTIKRRVVSIPFKNYYGEKDMTLFILLSDPKNYSLVKYKMDINNMHKFAEKLAFAKNEKTGTLKELRVIEDKNTGEKKEITTTTERIEEDAMGGLS